MYVITEREVSFYLDSNVVGCLPQNLASVRAPGNETHRRDLLVSYENELFRARQQNEMNTDNVDQELDEQNISRAREEVKREIVRMRREFTTESTAGRETAGTNEQNHGSTDAMLTNSAIIGSNEFVNRRGGSTGDGTQRYTRMEDGCTDVATRVQTPERAVRRDVRTNS